jgi:hypothetical protein
MVGWFFGLLSPVLWKEIFQTRNKFVQQEIFASPEFFRTALPAF